VENVRILLAVIAFLSGLALLASALVRFRRQRSLPRRVRADALVWFYGTAFLAVGLLLWLHSGGTGTVIVALREQAGRDAESRPEIPSSTPLSEHPAPPPVGASSAVLDQPVVGKAADVQLSKSDRRSSHRRSAQRAPTVGNSIHAVQPPLQFEDRVYDLTERAFAAIEKWFYRWGSPAPAKAVAAPIAQGLSHGKTEDVLTFPRIVFAEGTADLDSSSQCALKKLADQINVRPSPKFIEIEAWVNSGGAPEPFNYMLTQARAEVVRDFLVGEGVDTSRLMTKALGSLAEDSMKAESQIRFVARP
jgi:outer membrane protein OmpA-like peptidoglycan-associated protein